MKSFIKEEAYPEIKAPRGIYSRTDRFKVFVGPLISKIQKIVFSNKAFIKNVPVSERAQYIEDLFESSLGDVYAGDYTAYESHFTEEYMKAIEFVAYDYMCENNVMAQTVLRIFKKAVSSTNYIIFKQVELSVEATRMSGEMNTSLGNGLVNLIIINYICTQIHACSVTCIVEGDDSLFKTKASVTDKDFLYCGLTCKLEKHSEINTASFCGLIFDPENKTIVTDPIKVILKTPYLPRKWVNVGINVRMQILKCKALSIRWQYPNCPILVAYSEYILKNTCTFSVRKSILEYFKGEQEYNLMKTDFSSIQKKTLDAILKDCPTSNISINSRLIMERKFNISVEEQLELEQFFETRVEFNQFFHPLIYTHTTTQQRENFETHVFQMPTENLKACTFNPRLIDFQENYNKLYKLLRPLTREDQLGHLKYILQNN